MCRNAKGSRNKKAMKIRIAATSLLVNTSIPRFIKIKELPHTNDSDRRSVQFQYFCAIVRCKNSRKSYGYLAEVEIYITAILQYRLSSHSTLPSEGVQCPQEFSLLPKQECGFDRLSPKNLPLKNEVRREGRNSYPQRKISLYEICSCGAIRALF